MGQELSRNERIKEASDYLRGTLADGLRQEITGAISEDDAQLVKFHGMYLQDDRDLRSERTRKKMEKAFAFMIRVRVPGGALTTLLLGVGGSVIGSTQGQPLAVPMRTGGVRSQMQSSKTEGP